MNTFSLKELLAFIAKRPNNRKINMSECGWGGAGEETKCGCLLIQFGRNKYPYAKKASAGYGSVEIKHDSGWETFKANDLDYMEVHDFILKLLTKPKPKTYGEVKAIVKELGLK